MPELALDAASVTDRGQKRPHNEDYVEYFEPGDPEELARSGRIYIVADGVGGAAAGEVASQYTVKKILHEYYRSDDVDLGERLRTAIRVANDEIFGHAERTPELGRMGTTVVAAVIRDDELVVANVGDSRAYLLRGGQIRQITRDHSLVAQLVGEGSITPEEAEEHPKKNVVLRSIGADPDVYPDIFEGRLQPGDQLVLCSDGLTRYVSDHEILEMASQTQAHHAAQQLVDLANARGGKDNISVMLVRATEPLPASVHRGTRKRTAVPAPPAFDTIRDRVTGRATPLRSDGRPLWPAWAFGGAIAALVLFAALFFGSRSLWGLPPLRLAVPTAAATAETASATRETAAPTSIATESPFLAVDAIPLPTRVSPPTVPSSSPLPTPATAVASTTNKVKFEPEPVVMKYRIPPVGQGLDWIAATWGFDAGCIAQANNIVDHNSVRAGEVLTMPADCLMESGPVGELVFTGETESAGFVAFALQGDGATLRPIRGEIASLCGDKLRESQEAQSPDGKWMASIQDEFGQPAAEVGNLWIREAAGGGTPYLITADQCAADPVWSLDGQYLAFKTTCQDAPDGAIWIVPAPQVVADPVTQPTEAGHLSIDLPGIDHVCCWVDRIQ